MCISNQGGYTLHNILSRSHKVLSICSFYYALFCQLYYFAKKWQNQFLTGLLFLLSGVKKSQTQ